MSATAITSIGTARASQPLCPAAIDCLTFGRL